MIQCPEAELLQARRDDLLASVRTLPSFLARQHQIRTWDLARAVRYRNARQHEFSRLIEPSPLEALLAVVDLALRLRVWSRLLSRPFDAVISEAQDDLKHLRAGAGLEQTRPELFVNGWRNWHTDLRLA